MKHKREISDTKNAKICTLKQFDTDREVFEPSTFVLRLYILLAEWNKGTCVSVSLYSEATI